MEPIPISPVQISSSIHREIAYVVSTKIKRTLTEFTQVASPLGDPAVIPFHLLRDYEVVVPIVAFSEDTLMAKNKWKEIPKTLCHVSADSLWDLCEAL